MRRFIAAVFCYQPSVRKRLAQLASLLVVLAVVGSFFSPLNIQAAPNLQINYQGRLFTSSAAAVPDGDYTMIFRLYTEDNAGPTNCDAATSTDIWEETKTVSVANSGQFSTMFGDTTSLANVNFNQTLYLGVSIEDDCEMYPRKVLGTVPSAFEAQKLNNLNSSQFLRSDAENATTSASAFITFNQGGAGAVLDLQSGTSSIFKALANGNIGVGTSSPWAKFSIHANSSDTNIALFSVASSTSAATTTHFVVLNNGNIGVGTSSPFTKFSVVGSSYFNDGLTTSNATTTNLYVSNQVTTSGTNIFGKDNIASGYYASTYGNNNTASGRYSNAFGYQNIASATSTAIGFMNTASASSSLAIGFNNSAQLSNTTLVGINNQGLGGTAVGNTNTVTLGGYAFGGSNLASRAGMSIGFSNNTSGDSLIAVGNSNTVVGNPDSCYGYTYDGSNSFAFGNQNNLNCARNSSAFGTLNIFENVDRSSAVGYGNNVTKNYSSAFGYYNTVSNASGNSTGYASASGANNKVVGDYGSTFGYGNLASSTYASASGYSNTASSTYSSAFGYSNRALGLGSLASGFSNTVALAASSSVAVGVNNNISSGSLAAAFGYGNTIAGTNSSAFGSTNSVSGDQAWALGFSNTVANGYGLVIGRFNTASAGYGYAVGNANTAAFESSAFGQGNTASGNDSVAFGNNNTASGSLTDYFGGQLGMVALGYSNTANNYGSVAVGGGNTSYSTGWYDEDLFEGYYGHSVAMGYSNYSNGYTAITLGTSNSATATTTSAVGYSNVASKESASAFGYDNTASNNGASAFGYQSTASGLLSLTFGYKNTASAAGASIFGSNITNAIASTTMIGPADAAKVTILYSGNVGIGTTTPEQKLVVQGGLCVTASGSTCPAESAGAIVADGLITQNAFDLAESYPTMDSSLSAGEVVMLDNSNPLFVRRATNGADGVPLLGVISTKPGFYLGGFSDERASGAAKQVPVALAGRVPVKINSEGGEIKIGDYLTISSVSGIATKASTSSPLVIGLALESSVNQTTEGTIMMFVTPVTRPMISEVKGGQITSGFTFDETGNKLIAMNHLDLNNNDLLNVRSIISANGSWKIDEQGVLTTTEVRTNKLCIGGTCIDENQLQQILEKAGITLPPDPEPVPNPEPTPEPGPAPTSTPPVVEPEPPESLSEPPPEVIPPPTEEVVPPTPEPPSPPAVESVPESVPTSEPTPAT